MIEVAQKEDAKAIVGVITSSVQACALDHHNDPEKIQEWLSNKTTENIAIWIENSYAFVYKKKSVIVAFILLSKTGVLLLNYILPEQQGIGIGSALLNHVVDTSKANNIQKISLESTLTAKEFYVYNKFKIIEEIHENNNLIAYLMEREILSL